MQQGIKIEYHLILVTGFRQWEGRSFIAFTVTVLGELGGHASLKYTVLGEVL